MEVVGGVRCLDVHCRIGSSEKKKFSQSENRYLDQPDKSNGCSEGADALRQWAQAKDCGLLDSMTQTSAYKEARAGDWRTN